VQAPREGWAEVRSPTSSARQPLDCLASCVGPTYLEPIVWLSGTRTFPVSRRNPSSFGAGARTDASAIGHAGTAAFLSTVLGIEVPARRVSVAMESGDQALVLPLNERLPEGELLTEAELAAIP